MASFWLNRRTKRNHVGVLPLTLSLVGLGPVVAGWLGLV
jgi:hypothetical protein